MGTRSTGSEAFSLFICLDTTKFVLLSFFSPIKTIYLRVSTKPQPNAAKSPLPVDVRRSKTLMMTAFHFKVVSLHHVRMALNWTFCIKPFKRHLKLTANRVRVNYHFAELIMNTSKLWIPLWAEFSLVQSIFAAIGR